MRSLQWYKRGAAYFDTSNPRRIYQYRFIITIMQFYEFTSHCISFLKKNFVGEPELAHSHSFYSSSLKASMDTFLIVFESLQSNLPPS